MVDALPPKVLLIVTRQRWISESDLQRDMSMSEKKKSTTIRRVKAKPKAIQASPVKPLLAEVRTLILTARQQVAQTVNAGLTLLCWQIGTRIRKDILKEKRAEYGQEIYQSLSAKLVAEFGRGYSERNLANLVRFAEVFPDWQILQSLIAKLGWTHFQRIIYLDDPLKRDFYAEMCRIENWDTRTLARKIQSLLFAADCALQETRQAHPTGA